MGDTDKIYARYLRFVNTYAQDLKSASMNTVKIFFSLCTPGNINYSDCASQCDTLVLQYIWPGRNLVSKAMYKPLFQYQRVQLSLDFST